MPALRVTSLFIRRPVLALSATTVLCAALWFLGAGFGARGGIDAVLDIRGGHREVFEKAAEVGEIERTILVDVAVSEVFSTDGLLLVSEITDAFLRLDAVRSAKSLTHSVIPVRRGFSFSWEPLIPAPPWTYGQLEDLRRFCVAHPLIRDVMVSADGTRALISVEYKTNLPRGVSAEELRSEVRELLVPFDREGVELRATGAPFIELEIREAIAKDLWVFGAGALVLAGAVFRVAFLGWRLAAVLFVSHLLFLSILPGVFSVAGYRPEPFAMAIFPLLGAIQLTLLAHIGAAYLRASVNMVRADNVPSRADVMERAVGETGKACVFAALTTAVGLLALTMAGTGAMRAFGFWGAVGVMAGLALSFGPALSVLSLAGGATGEGDALRGAMTNEGRNDAAGWIAELVRRRSRALAGGAVAVVVLTVPGVFLLKPDVRVESFLPRGGAAAEAVGIFDGHYGGIHFAQLDFDTGETGGVSRREVIRFLWDLHRDAEAIPEVTSAYSYAQVLAVLNQFWEGGRPEAMRLPGEDWLIRIFGAALETFDLPLLGALTGEERSQAYLIVRMKSVPAGRYLEIVEGLLSGAEERAPPGVAIAPGGIVHEFLEADRAVVRAQTGSAAVVVAAVGLLFVLLWRDPVLVLAGLGAAAFPVAVVLGVAGYAGLTLNAMTAMAGAIAAGVAADDAVHFITRWRDALRRTGDGGQAVQEALAVKGPPIFFTTVILVGVFLLLGLSAFQPVAHLGLLAAAGLALALPTVFLVLSAALTLLGPEPERDLS